METEPSPPIKTNFNLFQSTDDDLAGQSMPGDLGFNYKLQPGDPGYVYPGAAATLQGINAGMEEKDPWADDWSPDKKSEDSPEYDPKTYGKQTQPINTSPDSPNIPSPDWDPNDPNAQPSNFRASSPVYNPNEYTPQSPDWDPNDPDAQPKFSISSSKSDSSPPYDPKNYANPDLKRREAIYDNWVDAFPKELISSSPEEDTKKEKITIVNEKNVGNEDLDILSVSPLDETDVKEDDDSNDSGKKGIVVDL